MASTENLVDQEIPVNIACQSPPDANADALPMAERLAKLRPMLVRVARRKVRNDAWAEDAVSETLVAALEQIDAFEGRSKLDSWLVGILKHKLVDQVRRHTRDRQFEPGEDDDGSYLDKLMAEHGHVGCDSPVQPQKALARAQFIRDVGLALESCPLLQSRAFVLYTCLEMDAGEVCRELGVNANHLGVIVHRAKKKLRAAIGPRWRDASALLV
jgi:RNA polymerase sigma-70 factor, ECF subfamily